MQAWLKAIDKMDVTFNILQNITLGSSSSVTAFLIKHEYGKAKSSPIW